MIRLGKKLLVTFGCAAKSRGLVQLADIINNMGDSTEVFHSFNEYSSDPHGEATEAKVAECWLLSVHALYEESKGDISDFLVDYRKRNSRFLKYELITSDGSKKWMVKNLTVPKPGQWLGPSPRYWKEPVVEPVWENGLPKTTECRRWILADLRDSPACHPGNMLWYLGNDVVWDPGNRIQRDAVRVWCVPR